jgi:hypothetical protein
MRHHFRRQQAMFNKGSLFYSHCALNTVGFLFCFILTQLIGG